MNKHIKSNKIKENFNTVRHLIMGQITTTQNLVAIKEVRHARKWVCIHYGLRCFHPRRKIYYENDNFKEPSKGSKTPPSSMISMEHIYIYIYIYEPCIQNRLEDDYLMIIVVCYSLSSWSLVSFAGCRASPVYVVATICHQVRCLRWGHPSLFHTATALLIWYKMLRMRDISYRLIWMKFINMLSVCAQTGTHRRFNWWSIAVLT